MKQLALFVLVAFAPVLRADVKLPAVFGNHMVIQRDVPLKLWGTAAPGETVNIEFDDEKGLEAIPDAKGNWSITIGPRKADGKSHKLIVAGKNKVELTDILIGDVWVGSGQSNMEWPLASSLKGKEAIEAAGKRSDVRLF